MKYRGWLIFASICALVIVCYFSSINNEFVWDDHTIISNNETIKDIGNIKKIALSEDTTEDMEHTGFYRPFVYISYAVEYFLWGENPAGYRIVNLMFHFGTALLVYLLGMCLFDDRGVSFTAAAVFAVHPVHVESISFIAARGGEMCGFYYILALVLFIKYRRGSGIKYLLFSSAAFFVSFLAKEFAITLFVVMFGYDIAHYGDIKKKISYRAAALPYASYIALTGVYLAARELATSGMHPVKIFTADMPLRIVDSIRVIFRYLGILLFPNNLTIDYSFERASSLFSVNSLIALVILIAANILLFRLKRSNKPVFVSALLFLAPILLVSGIIPVKGESILADRWLYIPAAGFSLAAAYYLVTAIERVCSVLPSRVRMNAVLYAVVIIVSFYSYRTVERTGVFKNELTLWSDTVNKSPHSFKAHLNHGYALYNEGMTDEAFDEFKAALKIKPDSVKAHYNIAVVYQNKLEYDKAIREYETIVDNGNVIVDVILNLAECYNLSGDKVESLLYYKRALKMAPDSPDTLCKISALYSDLHREDKAQEFKELCDKANSL